MTRSSYLMEALDRNFEIKIWHDYNENLYYIKFSDNMTHNAVEEVFHPTPFRNFDGTDETVAQSLCDMINALAKMNDETKG